MSWCSPRRRRVQHSWQYRGQVRCSAFHLVEATDCHTVDDDSGHSRHRMTTTWSTATNHRRLHQSRDNNKLPFKTHLNVSVCVNQLHVCTPFFRHQKETAEYSEHFGLVTAQRHKFEILFSGRKINASNQSNLLSKN